MHYVDRRNYHAGVLLEDDQAALYSQVRSSSAEQNRPRGNNVMFIRPCVIVIVEE